MCSVAVLSACSFSEASWRARDSSFSARSSSCFFASASFSCGAHGSQALATYSDEQLQPGSALQPGMRSLQV